MSCLNAPSFVVFVVFVVFFPISTEFCTGVVSWPDVRLMYGVSEASLCRIVCENAWFSFSGKGTTEYITYQVWSAGGVCLLALAVYL